MQNGMFFSIVSLFYCVLNAILFFTKEKIQTKENKIYSIILIVNFIGLIIEITVSMILRCNIQINEFLLILGLRLILLYIPIWTYIFTYYVIHISLVDKKRKEIYKYIGIALMVITSFLTLILPFNYYSKNGIAYSYGAAANLVYAVCGTLIGVCILFLLFHLFKVL